VRIAQTPLPWHVNQAAIESQHDDEKVFPTGEQTFLPRELPDRRRRI